MVSVGEVNPDTKNCISDTIFVCNNSPNDSNFDLVVFSHNLKNIPGLLIPFESRYSNVLVP